LHFPRGWVRYILVARIASPFLVNIIRTAVLAATVVLVACSAWKPRDPAIEFTTVPAAAEGGPDRLAVIGGRVVGAKRGQQIVLFARTGVGVWWVQPLTVQPFTAIDRDSTWKSTIHLGMEYAALLVHPGYRPPATTEVLPKPGGDVSAVAVVRGTGAFERPAAKLLTFSGYEWEVRQTPSDRGGSNEYAADNAWTDSDGCLHLVLRQREGRWTSAEVILTRSLGYGTYSFVVRDASRLDPAAAVGLLTWDDQGVEQNHRELDVEPSQWGDPGVANAQFVVQPYYVAANVLRFTAPPGRATHSFRWEPGRAIFRTVRGTADRSAVAEHEFTSGVPSPGSERVRMNLYFFRYSPSAPQGTVEVVIERFEYLP
jgi:hypothetical protein